MLSEGSVSPLFIKTLNAAWVYNGGVVKSVVNLTSSSGYAFANVPSHGYANGNLITITGATPSGYDGAFTIYTGQTVTISTNTIIGPSNDFVAGTVTVDAGVTATVNSGSVYVIAAGDSNNFAYAITGTLASPATGTITSGDTLQQVTDINYPATTVPGVVQLDDSYYVMDGTGTIWGSAIGNPLSWSALNFIAAEVEVDGGVALAKYLNYLMAFCTWSTEVFYNANQAPPASPLLRVDNAFMNVGCASAYSICLGENSVIWMGQVKEGTYGASAGRTIVLMSGFQTQKISTPEVDRILNASNLSGVYSMVFKDNGHSFYVLTLTDLNKTLVFDFVSQLWCVWTTMYIQSPQTPVSITLTTGLVQNTAIVVQTAHGYQDGDVVNISGATQTAYNGSPNITYIDANTYSYPVTGTPASPATGTITATGYTEGMWSMFMHTSVNGLNYFLDQTSGVVYTISSSNLADETGYINFFGRTTNVDMGSNEFKVIAKVEVISDRVSGNILMAYTKNDYQSYGQYHTKSLNTSRTMFKQVGRARRAAFNFRVTDPVPIRIQEVKVMIEGNPRND